MPGSRKAVDSWALVAWVRNEPAASLFEVFLIDAEAGKVELAMSWINAAATFYILAKRNGADVAEEFLTRLPSLPIRLVAPDEQGILAAARIKAVHPIAFGDAFALALAQEEHASVITGDEEIRRCRMIAVDWIGNAVHRK
jgi:uncharacterized protein